MNRRGFTLTELGVVAGVLVVLAAVGAAGLENAQRQAQLAADVGSARQWPLAAQMYAADNAGLCPWPRYHPVPYEWWNEWELINHTMPGGSLTPTPQDCYWLAAPEKDPNRDCRQTTWATMSPYISSPAIFQSVRDVPPNPFGGECAEHDMIGHYGRCCCEEYPKTRECYWGGDGIGGEMCGGWNAGVCMGYQWYWDLGGDLKTTGYGRFTIDQLRSNACPESPPYFPYRRDPAVLGRAMIGPQWLGYGVGFGRGEGAWAPANSGTTRGPDGLFVTLNTMVADITSNIDGTVVSFTWPQVKVRWNDEEKIPSAWNFMRTGGWLEMVQWMEGTHFLYAHAVP